MNQVEKNVVSNAFERLTSPGSGLSSRSISVCVAVPTYRREKVLVQTLRQVAAQTSPPEEIMVIDQTEEHDPETEEYLRTESTAGRLVWLRQSPPNLPAARNRALRESNCDVVVFIDDDVELVPGFVEAHRRNYLDPKVSAVSGKIVRVGWTLPRRARWNRRDDYRYLPQDGDVRIEGVAAFGGGNHSVWRTTMLEVGGYDERYIGWAYREDSDAALTLWKQNKHIVFDPNASLIHLAAPAGGCRLKNGKVTRPEWTVPFPALYFAAKHLFPEPIFFTTVLSDVRHYVFRKDNSLRPWRLPWAGLSFTFALVRALIWAKMSPGKD